ncbi:MAG: ATP-binding cassette domain-containing protein [Deltaproteobacteria bacterium]|nr:ATP-binding cassette domain-containing protein [Deltaproteobacteria bacterium]
MIELHHVSKTYGAGFRALNDISLVIRNGELAFLTGASGAGKSTLLKLMFRDEEPSAGQILIDGKNVTRLGSRGVAALRRQIGLVFQQFKLLVGLTALENVALAAEVIGVGKQASRTKAYHLLRELGLHERYDATPVALSAGEQQRVAIARALINEPILILADEPTGNLDADTAGETMALLLKARARGATVVIATHDAGMVSRYGDRVISLRRGELVDDNSRAHSAGDQP